MSCEAKSEKKNCYFYSIHAHEKGAQGHSQLSTMAAAIACNPSLSSSVKPSTFSQSMSKTPKTRYMDTELVKWSPRIKITYVFFDQWDNNFRIWGWITSNVAREFMNITDQLRLLGSSSSTANTLTKWNSSTGDLINILHVKNCCLDRPIYNRIIPFLGKDRESIIHHS